MKRWFVIGMMLLFGIVFAGNALAAPGAPFWSMYVGNYWVYDVTDIWGGSWTHREEVIATDTTTVPGVTTYMIERLEDGVFDGYDWFSISLEAQYWWKETWVDPGPGSLVIDPPGLLWAKNPIIVGDNWTSTTTGTFTVPGLSVPADTSLTVTVLNYESVSTPLGTYMAYKFLHVLHVWNDQAGLDISRSIIDFDTSTE